MTSGGTHGALDDLNSDGILLSSFAPTKDTSSRRVAGLYDGFPGLRNFRAEENGAEWITGKEQALTRIARVPLDFDRQMLPDDRVFLRIWTPRFAHLDMEVPVELTVKPAGHFFSPQTRQVERQPADAPESYEAVLIGMPAQGNSRPMDASEQHFTLHQPVSFPDPCAYERVYALPDDLALEPQKEYSISGRVRDQEKDIRTFEFNFRTDGHGLPVAD